MEVQEGNEPGHENVFLVALLVYLQFFNNIWFRESFINYIMTVSDNNTRTASEINCVVISILHQPVREVKFIRYIDSH